MGSHPGDINDYSPVGPRTHAPLASRPRGTRGVPWVAQTAAQKQGHRTRVKAPTQDTMVLWAVAQGEREDGPAGLHLWRVPPGP